MRTDNLKQKLYRVIYVHVNNRFKTVSYDVRGYSLKEARLYGTRLLKNRMDYVIFQIVEIRD